MLNKKKIIIKHHNSKYMYFGKFTQYLTLVLDSHLKLLNELYSKTTLIKDSKLTKLKII